MGRLRYSERANATNKLGKKTWDFFVVSDGPIVVVLYILNLFMYSCRRPNEGGQGKARQDKPRPYKPRPDKTRRDKSRQDKKIRQDKARKDKTR